jgi:hypothetical protein
MQIVPPIVINEENVLTVVPPLGDVMGDTHDHSPGFACHAAILPPRMGRVKKVVTVLTYPRIRPS